MEEHIKILLLRIVLTGLIGAALPVAHAYWGESPEVAGIEGPTAFALLIGMMGYGLVAAVGYFFVGSLLQVMFSRRLKVAFYYDVLMGIALILLLALAGVSAHYYSTAP